MREFALEVGKKNFFTFGEVWSSEEDIGHFIGRVAGDMYDIDRSRGGPGEEALAVEGLTISGRLSNVSFSIRRGEIVGVFGLVGSGVETLGRALYGALGPKVGGAARISGSPYRPRSPGAGKAAGTSGSTLSPRCWKLPRSRT